MSTARGPVSTSIAIGHETVYYEPSEQNQKKAAEALADSITSGMILHRTISMDLPLLSKSMAVVPVSGSTFRLLSLFAAALEDVITQIWILERCNNELAVLKTTSDIDYLKAVKYGVCDPNEIKDELDGIDPHNLSCVIYKVRKLDADRKYVKKLMIETYMSLGESLTYRPLINSVNEIEGVRRYRIELAEEENRNRMIRKEMIKQVRQQRNHIKTVLYDTEVIIENLRTQVEDSVLYSEVRSRYMDNWQLARTEQHTQTILDVEHDPATSIEYYKQRTDHELRVHAEVESLISIIVTETLEKIDQWMNKFDKDMEKIDLKIQVKKNEYHDTRDKRIGYEEMIELHNMQMKAWNDFKDAREKERLYKEKMLKSAIIVQAWWRGLLVRKQLGPYKPVKKKKKKKDPYDY